MFATHDEYETADDVRLPRRDYPRADVRMADGTTKRQTLAILKEDNDASQLPKKRRNEGHRRGNVGTHSAGRETQQAVQDAYDQWIGNDTALAATLMAEGFVGQNGIATSGETVVEAETAVLDTMSDTQLEQMFRSDEPADIALVSGYDADWEDEFCAEVDARHRAAVEVALAALSPADVECFRMSLRRVPVREMAPLVGRSHMWCQRATKRVEVALGAEMLSWARAS